MGGCVYLNTYAHTFMLTINNKHSTRTNLVLCLLCISVPGSQKFQVLLDKQKLRTVANRKSSSLIGKVPIDEYLRYQLFSKFQVFTNKFQELTLILERTCTQVLNFVRTHTHTRTFSPTYQMYICYITCILNRHVNTLNSTPLYAHIQQISYRKL